MKKSILILFLALRSVLCCGQITVDECHRLARENYPLVQRLRLIRSSEGYDLSNASKAYLPHFSLSARATWQTDVTSIPFTIPGYDIPTMSKDQYQVLAEVSQVVWDGGATGAAKKAVKAQGDVERAQFEVDMYALRERIDDLFFGILMLGEQLRLNEMYSRELLVNYDRVAGSFANGVATQTDLDAVRAEQLGAEQSRVQLESARGAYVRMLSAFTGQAIPDSAEFVRPAVFVPQGAATAENRPEMQLFDAMERQMETQRRAVKASQMPQLGVFVQGGYGRPGLNMLNDEFSPFAIGGVRLSWNFGSFYTRRNNLRKIETGIGNVGVQRETFLFNTGLQQTRLDAEYHKYLQIMADDDEIIRMRGNIVRASEAKLENGIIGAADLVRDMTAEQNARIGKAIHEIELLKTTYEIRNLINN